MSKNIKNFLKNIPKREKYFIIVRFIVQCLCYNVGTTEDGYSGPQKTKKESKTQEI